MVLIKLWFVLRIILVSQISLSVIVSKQNLGTINTVYSKAMQIPGKMLQKL